MWEKVQIEEEIRMAITMAALKEENKLANGEVNWNFVDADVSIDFTGHPHASDSMIETIMLEVYTAYKKGTSTRDWEWTADDQLNADICEATDGMCSLSHVGGY